jgi:hypothetical protein
MEGFSKAIDKLQSVGGVAAVLASGITAAVCLRYLFHGPEEVPPLLSHSMSVILGFYFGSRGIGSGPKNQDPN